MGTAIIPENGIAITKLDAKTSQITVTQGLQKLVVTVKDYMIQDFTDHAGSTIWYADKPIKSEGFPTMKPVKLCARAIVNSSIENEVVLDPFGGSGSTLIACEQLNRSCYIMDVDPICCDIIIKRWEEYGRTKTNT
jgi:DNA modification methylase